MEDTKPLVTVKLGDLRVSISRSNIISSIMWNIGRTVFQFKEQNLQYYHPDCFLIKNFFIEILIEELKPIVMAQKGG